MRTFKRYAVGMRIHTALSFESEERLFLCTSRQWTRRYENYEVRGVNWFVTIAISRPPKLHGGRIQSPSCKLTFKLLYQMLHQPLRPQTLHITHGSTDSSKKQHCSHQNRAIFSTVMTKCSECNWLRWRKLEPIKWKQPEYLYRGQSSGNRMTLLADVMISCWIHYESIKNIWKVILNTSVSKRQEFGQEI